MGGLILLSVLGASALISGVFKLHKLLLPLTLLGLVATFLLTLGEWSGGLPFFGNLVAPYNNGMLDFNNFAFAFTSLLLLSSLLVLSLSQFQVDEDMDHAGEFYSILLFTILGAVVMVSFSNLVMLFIGIEILS